MIDLDLSLSQVIAEARSLKIPVPWNIDPHVRINSRALMRFGSCMKRGDSFVIEISDRLLSASSHSCKEILAHEVLHTCYGCRNHGVRWKLYADRMNAAFGYNIERTGSSEKLGAKEAPPAKHLLICSECNSQIKRYRHSSLTRNPSAYRCICGGKLILKY